jgi:transposase InsO family protein
VTLDGEGVSGDACVNEHFGRGKVALTTKVENLEVWHRRMGHVNFETIKEMNSKEMVRGLNFDEKKNDVSKKNCDSCNTMKAVRRPFKKGKVVRASGKLDLVHSDICGPIKPKSIGQAEYVLTFTDDYSRMSEVFLLKNKSQMLEKLKLYVARNERASGRKLKILRTDNGGEYVGSDVERYLEEKGIKHETTNVYTPQENGVSERLNRTLLEKARCMLHTARLPMRFWGEAVCAANFVKNLCPTTPCGDLVPKEAWLGRKPSVSFLKTFGCIAFVRVPVPNRRGKLGERARKMIFVGYSFNKKGYRFWDKENQVIVNSRDAKFLENVFDEEESVGVTREDDEDKFVDLVIPKASRDNVPVNMPVLNLPVEVVQEEEDSSDVEDYSTESQGDDESEVQSVFEEPAVSPVHTRVLRPRTAAVKPDKYSHFIEQQKREDAALSREELRRKYGPGYVFLD